jgi:hypothetical protein
MKKIINIILFALILVPVKGFCETDDEDFKFISIGIGAGGFFANKHVANYYNGNPNNVNSILYVWNNKPWNDAIRNELNISLGGPMELSELPTKMRYKVTTDMMARFAFNLSHENSFFIQVNQLKLVAADMFTIYVGNMPGTSQQTYEYGKIWGEESRTMIDLGFQRRNELEARNWYWFYELAFNLTNTKVIENAIQIKNFKQSIMDRGRDPYGVPIYDNPLPQAAFGIGLAGTIGWQYRIGSNASFDFGITTYLQDINLEGYKNFHTNFNFFVRLNWLTL